MCCSCQHLKPEPWGYSCRHCGAWLDIGRAPTVAEVEMECGACERCTNAPLGAEGSEGDEQKEPR